MHFVEMSLDVYGESQEASTSALACFLCISPGSKSLLQQRKGVKQCL